MATAISVWAINSAFFIQGESRLPSSPCDKEPDPTLTLFGHRCRASKYPIPFFFGPSVLTPSQASRFMATCRTYLCSRQHGEQRTQPRRHARHRNRFTAHHVRWLASPASSRWFQVWADPTPLETGVVMIFTSRSSFVVDMIFLARASFGS